MSLSIGIVGLPNVGKSTLFNALTKNSADMANYPFCTIDPSVGVVEVPDERLHKLAQFSNSQKIIPAVVEFVDIAGLVKGASEGEGLGNKFLANIRETDAIAQVVRIFVDDDITHVHNEINPADDVGIINLELIMADIQTVLKRRQGIVRDVKRGDKEAVALDNVLHKLEQTLADDKLARQCDLDDDELKLAKDLHLLTMKPMLYVFNKKSGAENLDETKDARWQALVKEVESQGAQWVVVDAGIEHELKDFEGEEKEMFREELGDSEDDGVKNLIQTSYDLLGLMAFFTTGEKETRAWTIKQGSTAPEAGAAIHTDFLEKFIRADVIAWDKLLQAGSYAEARAQGLVRTEGKEYIVKEGDVIEFRI